MLHPKLLSTGETELPDLLAITGDSFNCHLMDSEISETVHLHRVHPKNSSGCLNPRIVLNPMHAGFLSSFPMIHKLDTV